MEQTSDKNSRKATVILSLEDEGEVCRLFASPLPAKTVAKIMKISRSTATKILERHQCRRKDLKQARGISRQKRCDAEVQRGVLATLKPLALRPVLMLDEDAGFAEAAAAARETAMAFLKQGEVKRALEFLRAEQQFTRASGADGAAEDPMEAGGRVALALLRQAAIEAGEIAADTPEAEA